uniref:Uncharacterized protein n=1 Tax=candidate division CPR3 bacterium TaxID=2268181 RepID=A0A7C5URI6_UNCC3
MRDWEKEYNEEKKFKNFLAKKYKVEGNPKLDKAFEIAWEFGHPHGYDEVEYYFSYLVDLIKS